ncbi:hypothetical protein HF086_015127, partial [Spodoptera exigua]
MLKPTVVFTFLSALFIIETICYPTYESSYHRETRSLRTSNGARGGIIGHKPYKDPRPTHPGYNRRNVRDTLSPQQLDSQESISRVARSVEQLGAASKEHLDSQEALSRVARSVEQFGAVSKEHLDSQEALSRVARSVEQFGAASKEHLDSQEALSRVARSVEQFGAASKEHLDS